LGKHLLLLVLSLTTELYFQSLLCCNFTFQCSAKKPQLQRELSAIHATFPVYTITLEINSIH